ncbi:MAG: winged helix-turn-helix domain-containing protein [Actinomycetota bacterium]|nr:winged helix-turn-helix domain-containing protein [Actinomycetota bacterium]MDQ2956195.1 winged helix-turn-helix domain-containing protein [Actinomycetota bacterium]
MQVALLGPLEVTADGRAIPISGARLRTLLLRLAAEADRTVSGSELLAAVWDSDRPADEANALQTLVSRLRRALGDAGSVQQVGNGYRLTDVRTDLGRFREHVEQARTTAASGDLAGAADCYRQALELWRGLPLAEVAELDWAGEFANRWQDERLSALAARIDCDVLLGRAAAVVAELEDLVRLFPLREQFTLALMTALGASGRPAEGLAAYQRLRQALVEQLGADPSPELREAHQGLLRATDSGLPSNRRQRRTNLRASLTSFLGRDDEVKRLSTLLANGRLATVVGPGGAGKTRLAGVAAGQQLDRMPDGVWLVELAPVTDEANLGQAVLASLGIWADQLIERGVELGRKSTIDRLLDLLADSECLLVIDNCEHLIRGVATLVDQLLGACPALKVLATSREPLGIDGEALCIIPPLSMPAADADPAVARGFPSVQLFADRAAAVSAGFRIDELTVGPVIEIVRRLDGLPLAIELAAARLRVLPVDEIALRLSDRFRLLTGGSRVAMPRHRTLRAVVEWSWDLLTDVERLLAERLAIFPSGATVASAQAVCADDRLAGDAVLDLLSALVDKSLLQVGPNGADGSVRYQMLETIREYGIEQLAERVELATLRLRHARHFALLAQQHVDGLRGPEQLDHLRFLEAERDNILSALAYLAEADVPEEAIALAYALSWYWMTLGRHSEASRWLGLVLDSSQDYDSPLRVLVDAMRELNMAATAFGTGSPEENERSLRRMAHLFDRLGAFDEPVHPTLPLLRSILTFFAGSPERTQEALEPAMGSTDPWIRASSLMFRAHLHENEGDLVAMRVDSEAALALFIEIGDRWGMASTWAAVAHLKVLDGDLTEAIAAYQRAAQYLVEFGAVPDESMLRLRLADLYVRTGDIPAAKAQLAMTGDFEFQVGSRAQRLLVDAAYASIAFIEGDGETIDRLREWIATELDQLLPMSRTNGHLPAISLATLAILLIAKGDLDAARERVTLAYEYGIGTRDMPVMASVAVAVAGWACAAGAMVAAARIHGAAAQLRGAPDPTDPLGLRLRENLVQALGMARYEKEFLAGRALDRAAALELVDPRSVEL